MALVSVIVAAWNAAQTLERCVASIAAQERVETEIIVVNDCSSDQTADVIARLARQYEQVRAAQTDQNGGPSAARNKGLSLARGEWIAVVDADDSIAANRLATLVEAAEQRDADVYFDNLRIVTEGQEADDDRLLIPSRYGFQLQQQWTIAQYTASNLAYKSPVLTGFLKPLFKARFLKEKALGYKTRVSVSEDYLLILESLILGARIFYLDHPGYNYFVYGSSLSGNFNPDAHRALIDEETALAARYAGRLSPSERQAIAEHVRYLRLAGVTNSLFAHLRRRDYGGFFRTLAGDPVNAPIYLSRIAQSGVRKIRGETKRGT